MPFNLRLHANIKKINNLCLPSAVFIAQVLVGPSIKLQKETIQTENNMVKNPNSSGVQLGATEKQLQLAVRAGLEPGASGLQVRRPNPLDHAASS